MNPSDDALFNLQTALSNGDELQLLMKGYFENAEKVCTDPNTASTWLGRRRHRLC